MLLDVIGVVVDLCGVAGELLVAVRGNTRIGSHSALRNRSDGQRRESVLGCRDTGYTETWQWLAERDCAHLIPKQILEQYAMAISRWIQCEECITEFGFLAKHPTTGNAIPSPYVAMSQSFSKQANNLWYQIYQVVKENCSVEYKGATPHDDMMERLLSARRGG